MDLRSVKYHAVLESEKQERRLSDDSKLFWQRATKSEVMLVKAIVHCCYGFGLCMQAYTSNIRPTWLVLLTGHRS